MPMLIAPCIHVLKSKPIKKGWTLLYGINDRLAKFHHLPWTIPGETAIHIVREHKCPGTDNMPYSDMCWSMDHWFTSKPLFDEILRLKQYTCSTIERKQFVPSFLTND
eukprot:4104274-Ditylum_brightwellii.AAC.1